MADITQILAAYFKEPGDEKLLGRLPDLDIKPYCDEQDHQLLLKFQRELRRERKQIHVA